MSIREKMNVVKDEEPEIYQTSRQEPINSNSTNMFSEQLAQIVEKMNDIATEQYSVNGKFSLIEKELEKVQKDRNQLANQNNQTLAELSKALKDLRTEVNKNQQDYISIVTSEIQTTSKELSHQVARTKALRQELIEFVIQFKQEQKPTRKERLMEIGLRTAVIVVLTSAVWVTLTLL